ncbi:uncharacterized protein LOC122371665, partial [Amphibalanus amphitrite]|uniref:uncharacterized protein LOC122371665 n=1 Tax=Amphibalanus amphitrite TaxID=1232801 RepID=UPI001C904B8C
MKKSAILRWMILEMVAASLVVSSPLIHRCRTDQFMDYLKNNDKKKIRICLSKNETYNSLCREELFLDIQGSKFPVEVLIKWRQLCSGQPEYNVTGTVTMGVESGLQDGRRQSTQDGRRQVMRLDGLTAGRLPPGRYIAMITVAERDERQEGYAGKSASLREEPRGSSDAPGRFIAAGRRPSEDTDSKRSQGITELYTSEFTKGLENACPVTNINMDTCFEQGFKNARLKFENMDPLHFNTTLKGGSRAVAWEVDGNVSVAGISNYTVKISKAESSDDPHQNRPLTITTAWVAPLWRIELGLTYHLTVIPDVIVIKMAARVAMAL